MTRLDGPDQSFKRALTCFSYGFVITSRMVRCDRPWVKAEGAVDYFRQHLRVGDYPSEGGQAEIIWFGRAAERLGLQGNCRLEALARLCEGQTIAAAR